jgi:myo-inositol-1-phosphate synthase
VLRNAEAKFAVWDSAARAIAGPLEGSSAYLMKSPPKRFSDDVAHDMLEEFTTGR